MLLEDINYLEGGKLELAKRYGSKLCKVSLISGIITGMQEFDYDISNMFEAIDRKGFPLSMILEGRKEQQ